MDIGRHAELFELTSGLLLSTAYVPGDVGPGRLTICATDPATGDSRETTIQLDPERTGTYRVDEWVDGDALLLIGEDRMVVVAAGTMRLQAVLPWEFEECELAGLPWLIESEALLFAVTETRVFCFDRRLAVRWCWTTRNESPEWVQIARPPVLEGDALRVSVRTMEREWELRLRIEDAVRFD